jgi:lipid II:glycine glycyltransferase (peptidoglycan interpeptide bridge formation enzyme)
LSQFYDFEKNNYYILNIALDFNDLLRTFRQRSAIHRYKKAISNNLKVKLFSNVDDFLKIHLLHTNSVFENQKLKNPLTYYRLNLLIESSVSNNFLLLGVMYGEICISSNIFLLDDKLGTYYTSGSFKEYQYLCPNEFMMIESIKELQNRGIQKLDLGNSRDYKEKYRPDIVPIYILKSKYKSSSMQIVYFMEKMYKKYSKKIPFLRFFKKQKFKKPKTI